ncbi:MAG: CapA family protein [Verrucomicrobia bacterium]|nr:CapA family protein [Verrucomicrobiota bacterium]
MKHALRLFLCGDVMTGRGIDQALSHPGEPVLYEPYVHDAREYVRLAERANGPIPRPVDDAYVWGDALRELDQAATGARVINLETSITSSENHWSGKTIQYRMHPLNIGCLTTARIDCCCLANNHVLDWGYDGLEETLQVLDRAGLAHAGAGRNAAEAALPAVLDRSPEGRVLVFSFGSTTSGIPPVWGATRDRPGVNLLQNLSAATASGIASRIRDFRRPGDVTIASIHWGENWGYDIADEQHRFAHLLIEGSVDVVHGHSSHHVKTVEVYRDRLVLYGCGDFVNDYEGIGGYEGYRSDLSLIYLVTLDPQEGRLLKVQLVPLQIRRFRLNRATAQDATWLCHLLNRLGTSPGTRVQMEDDGTMSLVWR